MKKRVLAFLMAFTLVMPMFAVSAFAAVDAVYNAVEDGLASFSFEGPGEERSLQAYISGDDLYAEVDEDAEDAEVDEDAVAFDRDANFDNTTWIEQQDADSDGIWADVPVGRTDEIAPQDGKTLSVWSNNDLVGSFDIVALQAVAAEVDPIAKTITVLLNREATQEAPIKISLGDYVVPSAGVATIGSDTVVIDIADYMGAYDYAVAVDNALEAWVNCGEGGDIGVIGGLDTAYITDSIITINATGLLNNTPVYIQYKGADWEDLGKAIIEKGASTVEFDVKDLISETGTYIFRISFNKVDWTTVVGNYVFELNAPTSITINQAMKDGLKVNSSSEFKLDITPAGVVDLSGVTVTSTTPTVLTIVRANSNNKWLYTAIKSGNAIVQVKLDGSIHDTQIIRVVP